MTNELANRNGNASTGAREPDPRHDLDDTLASNVHQCTAALNEAIFRAHRAGLRIDVATAKITQLVSVRLVTARVYRPLDPEFNGVGLIGGE